jgi:nucleoid DNA-binding protein
MRKFDLIRKIAGELDLPLSRAKEIYLTIMSEMMNELGKGKRMKLSGFGSFRIVRCQPRVGRNPRTGESIHVPDHNTVKFKIGKRFALALNNGKRELAVVSSK